MKKIYSLVAILLISCVTYAQSTSTRSQTYGSTDASSISFGVATYTDAASANIDTVKIAPRSSRPLINLTVVDSCVLSLRSVAGCFRGDRMDVYVVNPAQTGTLKLFGLWTVSTGTTTLSLTANKKVHLVFWFDGAAWVEESRLLNY